MLSYSSTRIKVSLAEKVDAGGQAYVNAEVKMMYPGSGWKTFGFPSEILPELIVQLEEANEKCQDLTQRCSRAASGNDRMLMGVERSVQCQLRTLLQDCLEEAISFRDEKGQARMSFGVLVRPAPGNGCLVRTSVAFAKRVTADLEDEVMDPDAPRQAELPFSGDDEGEGGSF